MIVSTNDPLERLHRKPRLARHRGAIMKIELALFFLWLTTTATAADMPIALPQPQLLVASTGLKAVPGMTAAKPAAMHAVPSPTISETSVTRQADGSLAMHCVQKPNPKIRQLMSHPPHSPSIEPQQP
jgi:hypothetical protein